MRRKLGEILVANGAVSMPDVEAALADQSAGEPSRLGDLLVATGKITANQLAQALAEQYELPYVELPPLPQAVIDLVPLELQRQYRFVPLKSQDTELSIAMADLSNVEVLVLLEQQWTKIHVHVASGDEIDALHATVSGIFKQPSRDELPSVAPVISPLGNIDDLFGALEDGGTAPPASSNSPVPFIAPVSNTSPVPFAVPPEPPRPSPAVPPRAEDLFGDLNLESARTGIPAQSPEAMALAKAAAGEPKLEIESEAPLIAGVSLEAEAAAAGPEPVERQAPPVPDEALDSVSEVSGPIVGLKEGTGPLLDLVADTGTGPVVDTPFFGSLANAPGLGVPSVADRPFSSPSSIGALAIPPPVPTAPNAPFEISRPPPTDTPAEHAVTGALPDWLAGEASALAHGKASPSSIEPLPEAAAAPLGAQEWTGALDHLAPSKLVLGLTRALLARGIVTEADILAALGQKK